MLTASAATMTILHTAPNVLTADLFKITLPDGTVLRWSSADRPFTIGAETYLVGPAITRTKTKRKVGIDVDVLTLKIMDDNNITLNGRPLIRTLHEGEFDGAIVQVSRLFLSDWNDLSPGVVPWFDGYVSDSFTDQGKTELRVKSMLGLLDQPMPKYLYMPACNNTFGDASCTKSKVSLTESGTVSGGSTTKDIFITGHTNANNAGYFELGVARFLTGPNAMLTRTVRRHTSGKLELSPALPVAPNTGDTVNIYPSCVKTRGACVVYANEANFRGFPYVPAPETMYGGGAGVPGAAPQGGQGQSPQGSSGGAYRRQRTYLR